MDWKKAVPFLSALATGGVPALLTTAAAAVGSALGREVAPTQDAIAAAVSEATPEQLLRLREIDAAVKTRFRELESEDRKTDAADRNSARKHNVDGGGSRRVFWLAVLIIAGVLGIEAAVLFNGLPIGVDGLTAGRILGTLDAALLAVLYYHYGSSSGSAVKTEMMSGK
jgi:hypothetical protein